MAGEVIITRRSVLIGAFRTCEDLSDFIECFDENASIGKRTIQIGFGPGFYLPTISSQPGMNDSDGPENLLRDSADSAPSIRTSCNTGLRYDRKEILSCGGRRADDPAIQRAHHAQAGHILPREIEAANRRSGS